MKEDLVKELGLRALGTRLKRIADAMSHSSRAMYKKLDLDIEPNWYLILKLVNERKAISVIDIADSIGFTHQSVITITNKMIKKGYLKSAKDANDLRRTVFTLTPKAIDTLPAVEQIWDCGEEVITEMLHHQTEILKYLDTIEQQFNQSSFGDRIIHKLKSEQDGEAS
ncbi:MarR family transcriptional regulator [Limibacter armeniacum]|uniref:MarR family winged helix-turn-helix transcriptional regulator n=1 Tax=Limibacter armeniacum TaxID=466084 RepID=UPI002FE586A4